MNILEKFQSIIIFIAILLGLIFSNISLISINSSYFIIPFLVLMLFGIFLNVPINDFRKNLSDYTFTKITLFINFLWTPIFAYFLGSLFLNNYIYLWVGFVMLMVTPCTDWYIIFTDIAKGNVPLSTSILPLNLILQLILLPVYLLIFFGIDGSFNILILIESILFIIILPFILAQIARYILYKFKTIKNKILNLFSSTQVIFLSLAIFCMFASQGKHLINNFWILLLLITPIILFFVINFILGRFVSKYFKLTYEDSVSLNLTTLARNSPIALAIAIAAFPEQPFVALALVIGPLIELPILLIVSQTLLIIRKNKFEENNLIK